MSKIVFDQIAYRFCPKWILYVDLCLEFRSEKMNVFFNRSGFNQNKLTQIYRQDSKKQSIQLLQKYFFIDSTKIEVFFSRRANIQNPWSRSFFWVRHWHFVFMLTQSSATFPTKQDRNKSFRAIKSYKSSKTGGIQCSEKSKPGPTLHIAEYEI